MKSLKEYFYELTEGYVHRNGVDLRVGSLRLTFYPKHVFYIVQGGPDLSIYKDGEFKPSRRGEIYLSQAAEHKVPNFFIKLIDDWFKNPTENTLQKIINQLEDAASRSSKPTTSQPVSQATKKSDDLIVNVPKKPKPVPSAPLFIDVPKTSKTYESQISEGDAMRKMKITTEVDLNETEGLYNTTDDRWSRRAKHQLSKNELQGAVDQSEFSKGESAIYEGQEVEVRIPVGPNGTTGIMLEGHLKMVKRDELQTLEEGFGVMGAMKPLGPLNRIMQLAGLEHSGAVIETEVEEAEAVEEVVEEVVEEAAAGTMFDSLYRANLNKPEYKNNPAAARVATVGDVLAGLQAIIGELPQDLPANIARQMQMVPGIGAELIKTATLMTKPGTPESGTK